MNGEPTVIPSAWESFLVTNTINGFVIHPPFNQMEGRPFGPNMVVAETEEHLQAFILAWAIVRKAKRQAEQGSTPKLETEPNAPLPALGQRLVMKPLAGMPDANVVRSLSPTQFPAESDEDYRARVQQRYIALREGNL